MSIRVKIRKLTDGDAHSLFKIYSDKEAMKFRGSKPMESMVDAEIFLLNQELEKDNILTVRKGVELIQEKKLIGSAMFRFEKTNLSECEIGYSIGRDFWGKGLGKETVEVMLQIIKEKPEIKDVVAYCHMENMASIKILNHLGFHLKGHNQKTNISVFRKRLDR